MNLRLEDVKLSFKSLLPLAATGAIFLGVLGYGAHKTNQLTEDYRDRVQSQDRALMLTARTGRFVLAISQAAHALIAYDSASAISKAAQVDFDTASKTIGDLLAEAGRLDKSQQTVLTGFAERAEQLYREAREPVRIAESAPGLNSESLSPSDISQLQIATKAMMPIDEKLHALAEEVRTHIERSIDLSKARSEAIEQDARRVIMVNIALALLALALGTAFSIWLSSRKIVRPIELLSNDMKKVADGALDFSIEGTTRRDEIGNMARAL